MRHNFILTGDFTLLLENKTKQNETKQNSTHVTKNMKLFSPTSLGYKINKLNPYAILLAKSGLSADVRGLLSELLPLRLLTALSSGVIPTTDSEAIDPVIYNHLARSWIYCNIPPRVLNCPLPVKDPISIERHAALVHIRLMHCIFFVFHICVYSAAIAIFTKVLYRFYCAGESVEKSSVTLQVHKFTMTLAPPVKPSNDHGLGLL